MIRIRITIGKQRKSQRSLELRKNRRQSPPRAMIRTAETKAAATRFTGDVSEATQQQQQRKSPEVSLPVQSPPTLRSMTKSPVNVHNYCVVDQSHAISSSSSSSSSGNSDWQRVLSERVLTKEAVEKEKAFEGLGHRQYYYFPHNGVGEGGSSASASDDEECLFKCTDRNAAVESQLEAILCNDSVENYYHKCRRRVSCDCEVCLSRELVRVKREILLMIRQQQTQVTDREEEVAVAHVPSAAAVPVVVDGSAKWNYLYLRKRGNSSGGVVGGAGDSGSGAVAEEEFEDENGVGCCGTDLGPFVMVTGSGCGSSGGGGVTGNGSTGFGAFLDMSSNNSHSITEKTATSTVEGQLNALLTSSAKGAEEREEGGGRKSATTTSVKRHTNLIENQLLTLEEQFWRTKGSVAREAPQSKEASSSVVAGGLEANEATALLSDLSQQTTMSDSTPVKRATIKVTLASTGGSPMVSLDDVQRVQSLQAAAAAAAATGGSAATASNFGRMKRFEQFLKSLVGKKASSLPPPVVPPPYPHAAIDGGLSAKEQHHHHHHQDPLSGPVTFEQPALKVRSSVELKSQAAIGNRLSVPGGGNDDDGMNVPPLRHSFGSMSSLNSAVQQKFLNILPISTSPSLTAAKRNLSVNNLSTIPERLRGQGRKATITCHRMNGRTATTTTMTGSAVRGLKTVSCSNFESLNEVGARGRQDQLPTTMMMMMNKCSGEETVLRRSGMQNCAARRLQMSKSANHLQSVMVGGPVRPLNRFRNSMLEPSVSQEEEEEEENQIHQQEQCSRCSSILSLAGGTMGKVRCSDSSVESSVDGHLQPEVRRPGVIVVTTTTPITTTQKKGEISAGVVQSCKLCLGEVSPQQMTGIGQCRCTFCTDCMRAYIEFEILEGAYEISCPDAMCPAQGVVTMNEIAELTSNDLMTKHNRYRLNREVELDKNRTWCPRAGCDTVCLVDVTSQPSSSSGGAAAMISVISPSSSSSAKNASMIAYAVKCPTCEEEFCSACKKPWHPRLSCEENMKRLAADGHMDNVGIPFDSDLIKCCPMCGVPIEKDEGCAQMMCKRCKHVFCWYCLASLDDDFLLRHYDKGPCKNKLGHSRASVVWHRAQVIGIFAGFGILLLVASPLLLLAAPCIVCCKCRICSGGGPKIEEEHEIDFDDPLTLHR